MKVGTPDLSKIAGQVASLIKGGVTPAAEKKAAEPTQPSKGFFKGLLDGAVDFVKAAAPDVVGLIPGVGPIAKTVLSTLNDDEWFSEYKSAGATFNELLTLSQSGDEPEWQLLPAIYRANCSVLAGPTGIQNDRLMSDFMPSVLAYVRNKTNNVLAEEPSKYTTAFLQASRLYAIYYTGKKYVELAQDQPLNIPVLSDTLVPLKPTAYSAFKGVIDSLEAYLKATVRLPYAWVEYLRWRFGTTFCSDNTGKPGLILYDYYDLGVKGPDMWENTINEYRLSLSTCGRAVADMHLAFGDHAIRYDVEKRHYDEKEFNLRVNLTALGSYRDVADATKKSRIFMDSRLDPSAAIQAVTISTFSEMTPIVVRQEILHYYTHKPITFRTDNSGVTTLRTISAGWHVCPVGAIETDILTVSERNEPEEYETHFDSKTWIAPSQIAMVEDNATDTALGAMTKAEQAFMPMAALGADALQLHHRVRTYTMPKATLEPVAERGDTFMSTCLAYDQALILRSQVEAIQRTAMRNLTRGSYKQKTSPVNKAEVRETVAKIETEVVKDLKA